MTLEQADMTAALAALLARRLANANIVRKKSSLLPIGSPMYYYCEGCGAEMTLPENHSESAPSHCDDCKILVDRNRMPELLVVMKQPLRILRKSAVGSSQLGHLGMTFPAGELVGFGQVEKVIYDHRDQNARPVLCPSIRRDIYVLVDELQAAMK